MNETDLGYNGLLQEESQGIVTSKSATSKTDDQEAIHNYNHRDNRRKQCIDCIEKLIIYGIVVAYLIYQTLFYLNDQSNSIQTSKQIIVSEMPVPFVYLWMSYSQELCNLEVIYNHNGSTKIINNIVNVSLYQNAQSILTQYENEWVILNQIIDFDEINWSQFLIVPSKNDTISVNGRFYAENLNINIACTGFNQYSQMVYYVNHQSLLYSSNKSWDINWLTSMLRTKALVLHANYQLYLTYQWLECHDKINGDDEKFCQWTDKYDVFQQGSYVINNTFMCSNNDKNLSYESSIYIVPDRSGMKTIYINDQLYSWTDIISKIGGMYSSVANIIALIALYLIYGFVVVKFNFKGLAPNAQPDYFEKKKFEALLKHNQYLTNQINYLKSEINTLKNQRSNN